MRSKKGFELVSPSTFMITMILIVLMTIVLIFFQSNLFNLIRATSTQNSCKVSVYTQATLKLSGHDMMETSKLDCPTNYVTVTKGKEAIPTIANEMYTCWDNFGRGQLELFQHEDDNYCVVCSVIDFKGLEGNHPGMFNYLAYQKPKGKSLTYLEFLNNVGFSETTTKAFDNYMKNQLVDFTRPLGIIFVYGKETMMDKKQTGLIGALGGGALGGGLAAYSVGWTGLSVLGITLLSPLTVVSGVAAVGITAGAVAGGYGGYLLGSDQSATWDAKLLILPYNEESIKKLAGCKYLPIKGENSAIAK
jgi:hypothetical protein